ncbi:MAG: hypothetical protein WD492_16620 [Alkalispirochaeta sp.]
MTELTHALSEYHSGNLTWEAFYRQALRHMDAVLTRPLGINAEGRQEIVAEFYPRFVKLCSDYVDCGSSFDAYLFTSLRFFVRTWQREQTRRRRTENALGCHDSDELSVSEDPADGEISPSAHNGLAILSNNRQRDTVRRQLLICLCKNLPLLDQDEISYYAALFGLPIGWIRGFESYLHERRERISQARTGYREHRDRHYAAMLHHQIFPGTTRHDGYDPVEFHRRRWKYYRKRLQRQTVHLTNREVATILGIPKGSVDSALSNLSRRLEQRARAQIGSEHAYDDTFGLQ